MKMPENINANMLAIVCCKHCESKRRARAAAIAVNAK